MNTLKIMRKCFENHIYGGKTKKDMKDDIIRQTIDFFLEFKSLSSFLCVQDIRQKLIQSRLQSIEIKTGDFYEEYFTELIGKNDKYINLNKNVGGKRCDLLFKDDKEGKIFFVEMKVRDQHDSTKKTGQTDNFNKKIDLIIDEYLKLDDYKNYTLIATEWFMDELFDKNKEHYLKEIKLKKDDLANRGIDRVIINEPKYGGAFINTLLDDSNIWDEFVRNFDKIRKEKEIDVVKLLYYYDFDNLSNKIVYNCLVKQKEDKLIRLFFDKENTSLINEFFSKGNIIKKLKDEFERKSINSEFIKKYNELMEES